MTTVLVTGAAGFIGYHVSERLLQLGDQVIGIDNLNTYYDVALKRARLARLTPHRQFSFQKLDLADSKATAAFFEHAKPDRVIHLAAQAGVRYSIKNPIAYLDSNLTGFLTILEGCRHAHVRHLVFASSSSVYGDNTRLPFSVRQNVDHPVSLYGATKKANELMAHAYSHLYNLPATGLRFFTVYGPWGRPDMAAFLFTKAILEGRPIELFNQGNMMRDFTYIDDIVEGVVRVSDTIPEGDPGWCGDRPDPATSSGPYRLYNIGNNQPVKLIEFVQTLEQCLGCVARKTLLPLQPGDVVSTCADIDDLEADIGFRPSTPLADGLQRFVDWYRDYYKV